jgi:superfamily II helicase
MDRENDEKTSSVHFLRFEFTPAMIAALKGGAALAAGIDHPNMSVVIDPLPAATRAALVADFAD